MSEKDMLALFNKKNTREGRDTEYLKYHVCPKILTGEEGVQR